MGYGFLGTFSTPSVRRAQAKNGADEYRSKFHENRTFEAFTPDESGFIAARDSFYIATVAENGWPYIQHRGGPAGFLRVLDEKTLGFADFRGNRQYISVGNLGADDRAALFLMDYPHRQRLKILGHIEIKDVTRDAELASKLAVTGYKAKIERAMLFHLESFDWNCPQHITPRFTEAELVPALAPIRERLESLEAENKILRARLAQVPSPA
jgi:predicted pyridoxine 5'-phosphate oxidase superfamily flavin-nucleotide-binding protein